MPHRTVTPLNRDELGERLRLVVCGQFDIDPDHLTPNTAISGLGADSLGALELTMAVEDAFDIEIPDRALDQLHTFRDVADYLAERLAI